MIQMNLDKETIDFWGSIIVLLVICIMMLIQSLGARK
jgi:hypothetical protein